MAEKRSTYHAATVIFAVSYVSPKLSANGVIIASLL